MSTFWRGVLSIFTFGAPLCWLFGHDYSCVDWDNYYKQENWTKQGNWRVLIPPRNKCTYCGDVRK